jgi:hypothetical protein
LLGVESVAVRPVEMDDLEARMWAISENLHRVELTVLQRSLQIDEYAGLAKKKREAEGALQGAPHLPSMKEGPERVSVQVAQKPGHPEGGDSLAARDLGVTREEVTRAHKIAKLSDEAVKEAEASGLDDNQSALLKATRASGAEAQVGVLRDIRTRGRVAVHPATARGKRTPVHSRDPIDDVTRELIMKCAGPKSGWRSLDRMSSTTMLAKRAIKDALGRLGDAVKRRGDDGDAEHLIEGDRDELLVRAGLMIPHPEQSAVDSSAELASLRAENKRLRAENADLRTKLADANAEVERLQAMSVG